MSQLVEPVRFLHALDRPILHRDLKPDNYLMRADETPVLTDFGVSTWLEPRKEEDGLMYATSFVGSPLWMAPELHRYEEYNLSADIYALGIVLWQVAPGLEPFPDAKDGFRLRENVIQGKRPPLTLPVFSQVPSLAGLIQRMWHAEPGQRPTCEAVLSELQELEVKYKLDAIGN